MVGIKYVNRSELVSGYLRRLTHASASVQRTSFENVYSHRIATPALRETFIGEDATNELFSRQEAPNASPSTQHQSQTTMSIGWVRALQHFQSRLLESGLPVTYDDAKRVISLFANQSGRLSIPPISVGIRWFSILWLERCLTSRDEGEASAPPQWNGELPTSETTVVSQNNMIGSVLPILMANNRWRSALMMLQRELALSDPTALVGGVERAAAAALDQTTPWSVSRAASAVSTTGNTLLRPIGVDEMNERSFAVIALLKELQSVSGYVDNDIPTHTIYWDAHTGTLFRGADRVVYNCPYSCAIYLSPLSIREKIDCCRQFRGYIGADAAAALLELEFRLQYRIGDYNTLLSAYEKLPEVSHTPFLAAVVLRARIAVKQWSEAFSLANNMCNTWGPVSVPASSANALFSHLDIDQQRVLRGCQQRSIKAANHLSRHSIRISDQDNLARKFVSIGQWEQALQIVQRMRTRQRSEAESPDELFLYDVISATGSDWRLALSVFE